VFGEFWVAAKFAKHYASSTSQKFLNNSFYFVLAAAACPPSRKKFIKGAFARFRPPQPPVVIHRRKSGGWEAESFLVAEVVTIPYPPKAVFVLGLQPFGLPLPAFKACCLLKRRRNPNIYFFIPTGLTTVFVVIPQRPFCSRPLK
jgi:hypothetical protein